VYLLIASGEFSEEDTFFKCFKYLEAAIRVGNTISPSCIKVQIYEKEDMKNY